VYDISVLNVSHNPMDENQNQQMGGHHRRWHRRGGHGAASGAYGLGFIGAAVYFIQNAVTFWGGVVGVLKAIVWPAILVYNLLGFLGL